SVPALARGALAVPARDLLVRELPARRSGRVALRVDAVAEAERLGPDAGVDDADDDVLAGVLEPAELIPEPARGGQAQERRGRRGVAVAGLRRRHRQDVIARRELVGLGGRQAGGEAVEAVRVVVELP